MFCKNCGTRLEDWQKFCSNCGTPVQQPEQTESRPVTPVESEPSFSEVENIASETPVVETPVVETPVVETPVVETPVVETPVVETPVVETPVVEAPVVETPVVETPVVETPVMQTPSNQQAANNGYAFDPYTGAPTGNAPQTYAPAFGGEEPPKTKKKGSKVLIAVIIAVAVLAVLAIVAFATGIFSSPAKQMQKLEKQSVSDLLGVSDEWTKMNLAEDGLGFTMTVEVGQYLKDLLSSSVDISWLNNMQISMSSKTEGNDSQSKIRLVLNDSEIATLDALIDLDKLQGLFGLGGLSDKLLKYDLTKYKDEVVPLLSGKTKTPNELIEKYYGMIVESYENVEKSSGEFTANGVVENCKTLTATLTDRQVYELAKKLLTTALDDVDVKAFLEQIYPTVNSEYEMYESFAEFYSDYRDEINFALDEIKKAEDQIKDDPYVTVTDYVSDGEITGRRLKFLSTDAEFDEIIIGTAHDGDKFGSEITIDGETFVKADGTRNGSVLNGTVRLFDRDRVAANFKLVNFDRDTKQGEMIVTLPTDYLNEITGNSSVVMLLSAASLKINIGETSATVDVTMGENSLAKLTVEKTPVEKADIDKSAPTLGADEWTNTLDITAFFEKLKAAGVPEQFLSSILD